MSNQAEPNIKEIAGQYWRLGLNIVPVKGKTPLIKWAELQSASQSSDDFAELPWAAADGFALIGGAKQINGLYLGAIDYDVKDVTEEAKELGRKFLKELLATRIERTPSGGEHWVFYSRKQPATVNSFHDSAALELLGRSKLIVVWPSKDYVRMNDSEPTVLEDLESTFYDGLYHIGVGKSREVTKTVAPRKRRRKAQARICCEAALERDRHIAHAMRLCIASEHKRAGYSDEEIVDLFRHQDDFDRDKCLVQVRSADPDKTASCASIKSWGYCLPECPKNKKEPKEGSQADRLVTLCEVQQPVFFHDQHKTPYIRVRQAGVNVLMPIRSRQFKSWFANLMWQTDQKVPGTEGLSSAINVLQGKALLQGEQYTLYNRVAPAEDGVWIDMGDSAWRAIKVTATGWTIVDNPPILFRRYSHQLPLPEPERSGDAWKLLSYLNIDEKDEGTRLVLMCTCVTYWIPLIPHPILVFYGIQGSGKTLVFRIIRSVFDPSSIEVLIMPRDERERVQQLDHHWLAFYDNITSIPTWISDSLCRAATGGGFTKRELYSDDDDVIYNFKRCVGLNGINIAAQRGDLLDRTVLVSLQNIPKEKRKTEARLLADFEKERASILGGFLDVLVRAFQAYPTINPDGLFRMADFTRWGCAIAKALGKDEKEFLEAYEEKVKSQVEEAAHASPVATVLLDWLEKRNWEADWEGSPTDLFTNLLGHAKLLNISTRQHSWPKAPHVLVRQLNELAPSLKSLGWEIEASKSGGSRRISITSVPSVPSAPPDRDGRDGRDASDAILTSSSMGEKRTKIKFFAWLQSEFQKGVNQVLSVRPLNPVERGKCPLCQTSDANLVWQIQLLDGSRYDAVCVDCGGRVQDLVREFVEREAK
ncbi:MAG TPA: hypothetical protein VJ249_09700 [Candidatus Bathyarchaeia archaeon]|nr:hypothetical protein [Candidatus Bathyarchaeia archaeon]